MSHTRADAWSIVCEFTKSENLRRHMLAVEAVMRSYATRLDGDADTWGIAGLLHDFDYERFPEEHPVPGVEILAERGWSDEMCRAVMSHAEFTGVARESTMEKALGICPFWPRTTMSTMSRLRSLFGVAVVVSVIVQRIPGPGRRRRA